MTWTKIGTEELDAPALILLSRGTRLLHVEAKVWSNRFGTDGRISRAALARFTDEPDPELAAKLLVEAGAWSETADGWEIVDFLKHQPSAADVDRVADLSRQRQRRQRQHRNGDHSLCEPRYCEASRKESRAESRSTDAVSHNTRTVPSRAEGTRDGKGKASDAATPPARRQPPTKANDEFDFTPSNP